jgi:hypothetical protein
MNEFLNQWQPIIKDVNERDLVLVDQFENIIKVHASEGDTLYLSQKVDSDMTQRVSIMRDELYNIIFNFMSVDELVSIAHKKINREVIAETKPYESQKS